MQLYYTGALTYLGEQLKSELSLGGFVSSSLVPNGKLEAIFPEISLYTIDKNDIEVRAIVLKNESTFVVNNIRLWFVYPTNSYSKLEVSAVNLSQDSNGGYYMEKVLDTHSLPYYAEFYEADGEVGAVSLGSLGAGSSLGLWLKRSLNKESIETVYECENLNSLSLGGEEIETREEIQLIIDWDEPE